MNCFFNSELEAHRLSVGVDSELKGFFRFANFPTKGCARAKGGSIRGAVPEVNELRGKNYCWCPSSYVPNLSVLAPSILNSEDPLRNGFWLVLAALCSAHDCDHVDMTDDHQNHHMRHHFDPCACLEVCKGHFNDGGVRTC